jgi:hypothetical protein
MRELAILGLLSVLGSCSSNSSSNQSSADLSVQDQAIVSKCGQPNDKGNSIGIGRFCVELTSCADINLICSHPVRPDTYFCTKQCTPPASGPPIDPACGENTICQCDALGCGCTPVSCGVEKG